MGVHAFPSIFQRFVLHQIFGSATSLILGQRDGYDLCLFSSPQPHNPYERSSSSSLIVTADFLMKLPKHLSSSYERHAFGLFLLRVYYEKMVICNPSTGQLALLPDEEELISSTIYLLFDPVDKQVKVLSLKSYKLSLILTLGTGDDLWREIYCPLNNLSTYDLPEGICINGVLYYFARRIYESSYLIVCLMLGLRYSSLYTRISSNEKEKHIENLFVIGIELK